MIQSKHPCITLTSASELTVDSVHLGGREAAAQLRQHNSRVPIIFLTGETAASMRKCTKQFAPSALLLKPCSRLELIAQDLHHLVLAVRAETTMLIFCLIGYTHKFTSAYNVMDSACQDHNVSRQCIRLLQEQYTKHAVQYAVGLPKKWRLTLIAERVARSQTMHVATASTKQSHCALIAMLITWFYTRGFHQCQRPVSDPQQ
eukprot:6239-Heterococcus_DN1.PRE.1